MKMNWGIIIGLIGGGIGILVALVAVIATKSYFGIIMIVVVVGIMGTVFWKVLFGPMMLSNRLAKNGYATNARVMQVSDTGVTVNNSPQVKLLLEVTPPNGATYLVETKQLISRLQTSMFQPGMMVPVLIDLNDKNAVSLNYEGVNPGGGQNMNTTQAGVTIGPWAGISKEEADRRLVDNDAKVKELLKYGVSSNAYVTKYTWLGIYVNGQNEAAEIEVQVTPKDRPAFSAKAIGVIMQQSVPKFQPGEEIFVKYDPNNITNVTIEHS